VIKIKDTQLYKKGIFDTTPQNNNKKCSLIYHLISWSLMMLLLHTYVIRLCVYQMTTQWHNLSPDAAMLKGCWKPLPTPVHMTCELTIRAAILISQPNWRRGQIHNGGNCHHDARQPFVICFAQSTPARGSSTYQTTTQNHHSNDFSPLTKIISYTIKHSGQKKWKK
jgi:hypothetical protein